MLVLTKDPIEIRALVASVQSRYASAAAAKGLLLECGVDRQVPPVVSGDARRVDQILANLIGNAIKFTAAGRVSLQVRWEPGAGDDGALLCTVADTGIGMGQEDIAKLFSLFTQADNSRSRSAGGSGLGLAVVRHVLDLMGGHVSVQSKPGIGSVFTVRIPCQHA